MWKTTGERETIKNNETEDAKRQKYSVKCDRKAKYGKVDTAIHCKIEENWLTCESVIRPWIIVFFFFFSLNTFTFCNKLKN